MKIEEEKEGLGLGVFSLFGEERERDRGGGKKTTQ